MYTFFKKLLFLGVLISNTSLFADVAWLKNINISNASSVYEYDNYLEFAVTIEAPPLSALGSLKVHYKTITNGSATAGTDYTYTEGDLEFESDDPTTKTIKVPILNDAIHELTEHVTIEVTTANVLYEVIDGSGDGTIYDDDLEPLKLTNFYDKGVVETDTTQTLYLVAYFNQNLPSDVTVTYHTVDNTAHAGSDYVGVSGGTVTALHGNNRVLLPVTINGDASPEPTEDFNVIIDSISSGTIDDNQSTATITDNDDIQVYVHCSDADEGNIGESNNVACHIYLAKPYPAGEANLTINYNSQDGGSPSAVAGDDYTAVSGSVTFTTGDDDKIVNIPTIGDSVVEDDENVTLVISGSSYIVNSQSQAKILNDDGDFPGVDFSTADVSVVEGNSSTRTLKFHCELNEDAIEDSYFDYYTLDDTAEASDNDYVAISTTRYNISEGTRDIDIEVTVNGDTNVEKDELFYLKVKDEHHIVVSGHKAEGTIINDDGTLATLKFEKPFYDTLEGNNSTKELNITLILDNPALAGSSFNYYTKDGSATLEDNDYVKVEDTKHTFSGGETNITIPVTINGDTNIEDNQQFYLHIYNETNLSISGIQDAPAKIINDDGSYPKLDIENPSYSTYEGNSSTHSIDIKLVLDKPALENTSVEYYTFDMSAQDGSTTTEDNDYVATTGTITIPKDSNTTTFQVTINGDTNIEPNEIFIVALKNPKNVTFGRSSSGVYILNDDVHNEDPFTCDEHMYLSSSKKRGSQETGKMWLHRIDTRTSPFRFEVMDDEGEDNLYNAIGYNPQDNYIYGLYHKNLIKISKTGKIIDLGEINMSSELALIFDNYQFFAGAIYDSEHYYISGLGVDTNKMYIIDINNTSLTEKSLSQSINIKDFSLSPDGKFLYGIIDGGQFVKIDTFTGIVTKIGVAHNGEFDSSFSDKNGRFFANDSQGSGFYEFNTHTGAKSFLSNSQPATFNDGTNCLNAELIFTDYGDAPITYGTPKHTITNGIFMGTKIDHDINAFNTLDADGDDSNGEDDEDGVTFVDGTDINGSYFEVNDTQELKVTVSKNGFLNVWIDFDIDGTFSTAGDQVITAQALTAGTHTISFNIPSTVTKNQLTYIRFRYSSTANLNFEESANDGEVEDYAIKFGSPFQGIRGRFNVQRTNSALNAKDFALYTQIVGRDFDYHVVFYDENMTNEEELTKVPVKIDLMDATQPMNPPLYTDYYYFSHDNPKSRILVLDNSDLNTLPATKEALFKITYAIDANGAIVQQQCGADYKSCFESLIASSDANRSDKAQDKFAIRPESFFISIADHSVERTNSNNPNRVDFAAGYEYNLSILATEYRDTSHPSFTPAQGYNVVLERKLDFNSSSSCIHPTDNDLNISITNGLYRDLNFNNQEVGHYVFKLAPDTSWTAIDQNGQDCESNQSFTSQSVGTVADFNIPSGCDIVTKSNNILLNFHPYQFSLENVNFSVLPIDDNEFIYMDSVLNEVGAQLIGRVVAQNAQGNPTQNFTQNCVATDFNLLLDVNITSDTGLNTPLQTTVGNNGVVPIPVTFNRSAEFNNDNAVLMDSNISNIQTPIVVRKENFLETNASQNGSVFIDLRYNISKNINRTINPIKIDFHTLTARASDAQSNAEEITDWTPIGIKNLNQRRFFYFTQVAPDKVVYPRVHFTGTAVIVNTPLSVDIFCKNLNDPNFCTNMNIFENTLIYASPRKQEGWYISSNHNQNFDGNINSLNSENPISLTVTPNVNVPFTNGQNYSINSSVNNSNNSMNQVTVNVPSQLQYLNPHYSIPVTGNGSSEWTGIGEAGNVISTKPNTDKAGKSDW